VRPVDLAAAPPGDCYRIGRLPDPLAWVPLEFLGGGRFDDPARRFRTRYVAESRLACFVEVLAQFRPAPEVIARLQAVTGTDEPLPQARCQPTGIASAASGACGWPDSARPS